MDEAKREKTMNPEFHELRTGAPLREVLDFSYGLTVERNNAHLPTYESRVLHLILGTGEMLDTIRRVENDLTQENKNLLGVIASKIILRIFTVMQDIDERSMFISEVMNKYPAQGCSYCGQKPCICEVDRPSQKIGATSSDAQKTWTIKDWQTHMGDVYGANNKSRGLTWVGGRLSVESTEVLQASKDLGASNTEDEKNKYRVEVIRELAYCFAWVIGICNVAELDLESAFVTRYGHGCPKCGNYPCTCGPFSSIPERKEQKNTAV